MAVCLLVAGGCASSASIEQRAAVHERRADEYASARDYDDAAREQRKADELHRKASEHAFNRPPGRRPPEPPEGMLWPARLKPTIP
jgi:hypothetical protein